MFVSFFMAFGFSIATPQVFAETEGSEEASEVVVQEAPGFLVQIPAEARLSYQFDGVSATVVGDWMYISPLEGKESEASLLRETFNSSGVKTYPNRMIVLPPEKSLLSKQMEDILNESVELTGFDGTPFMNPKWYNEMLGLGGSSTLPLYYRTKKPMACVVDSGVDIGRTSHLRQISDKSFNFESMNRSPNASFTEIEGIHGTATASLMLEGLGTNSNLIEYVHLVALSEWGGSEFALASAIYYGADLGCDVFNMSLGFSSSVIESPIIDSAFSYAEAKGSVFIIAAGNDGEYVSYPANKHGDIIVGAVDRGSARPIFSNRPKTEDEASRFVYAPGHQMVQTVPRWQFSGTDVGSGTSFATPLVAALVLNEMLHHPLTAQQAVEKVLLSAHSQGTEMESWIPYASNANRIPQISNISVLPGVVTNSGTIKVVAKVTGNTTDPLLVNYESGREVSLAKMVSLGNGIYSGEMVVENLFQTRYKKLWVKAENDFGSYMAPTPSFLMIGKTVGRPEITFTGNPVYGQVLELNADWDGAWEYAWMYVRNENSDYLDWFVITPEHSASVTVGCRDEVFVGAFLTYGEGSTTALSYISVTGTPPTCGARNHNYLGTKSETAQNSSHMVFTPGWAVGNVTWSITTPQNSYSVTGDTMIDIQDFSSGLKPGDQIIVGASWDGWESESEVITVVSDKYQVALPMIRN
jgi:hypothetical protein